MYVDSHTFDWISLLSMLPEVGGSDRNWRMPFRLLRRSASVVAFPVCPSIVTSCVRKMLWVLERAKSWRRCFFEFVRCYNKASRRNFKIPKCVFQCTRMFIRTRFRREDVNSLNKLESIFSVMLGAVSLQNCRCTYVLTEIIITWHANSSC